MSSVRQQVTDALAASLRLIRTTNGYQTEAGANVFVWRKYELTASELPCLLVSDTALSRDMVIIGTVDNTLTAEIVAVAEGSTSAAQARLIEADLIKCLEDFDLAAVMPDWGALRVEQSTLAMEQHEQVVAAVSITVKLNYRTAPNQS
jgi:hypothetical protein